MSAHPRRRIYFAIFLLVLAPIGAAVVVSVLLLFGVEPHSVFAPGWAVKRGLEACGLHVANPIAVASTVAFYWAIIAGVGLLWEWRQRGR